MDDLQFRRMLYADPSCSDSKVAQAKAEDPAKLKFAQELETLEQKLKSAMKVDVPDDLANKLILRQTLASHQHAKRKNRIQLALAASVAFAFGLSFNFMQSNAYDSLGSYALAHTHHEESMFSNNSNAEFTLASVNQKMSDFGGNFTGDVGKLVSVGICTFGGIKALHLVYQGDEKPVTVYILSRDSNIKMQQAFSDDSLHGIAEQKNKADIVIVADKQEPLEKWQQNINKNISWSI
jgi:hypothetical protein